MRSRGLFDSAKQGRNAQFQPESGKPGYSKGSTSKASLPIVFLHFRVRFFYFAGVDLGCLQFDEPAEECVLNLTKNPEGYSTAVGSRMV